MPNLVKEDKEYKIKMLPCPIYIYRAGDTVLTDYVIEFKSEGNAAFIGRNIKGALSSDKTWHIKRLWYKNNILEVNRFENVSWDERYNLINN